MTSGLAPEGVTLRSEGPLFDAAPDEFGSSRLFISAAALAVGVLTGFAGGYITGQRNGIAASSGWEGTAAEAPVPTPPPSDVPAQTYTETPVAELSAVATPAATAQAAAVDVPRAAMTRPARLTGAGGLFILSRPSGAQVYLDERLVGATPLSIGDVAAGTHAVRIALPGHQRWETAITVTGGSSARVAASLER